MAERKGRRSWWGGDSSTTRRPSKIWKTDEEKQRSDKETSGEKPSKEKKDGSKGDSQGEKVKVGVEVKGEGSEEEVQKGSTDEPDPERVEVVGKESPPVWEGETGEVRRVDQQLKFAIVETEDDTTGSLTDTKSLRPLNSSKPTNNGQGNAKRGKKRWSLMIPRRTAPEETSVPSKKFTEDVAGSRFETAGDPEGERCAGDYPPIYINGFVSLVLPHTTTFDDVPDITGRHKLHPGESVNPRGNPTLGS